jgi:thioredoxin 1
METLKKSIELTDATFEQEVLHADTPVLVDFGAEWCPPCKMIAPIIDSLAVEYAGKAKITKLDVDENAQATTKYNVRNLPTLLIFKNGSVVDKIVGAVPKKTIAERLQAHM